MPCKASGGRTSFSKVTAGAVMLPSNDKWFSFLLELDYLFAGTLPNEIEIRALRAKRSSDVRQESCTVIEFPSKVNFHHFMFAAV